MKKIIFAKTYTLIIIFLCLTTSGFGQSIFTNNIDGIGINQPNRFNPFTNGQVIDPNITVSGIGRGTGITGVNTNDQYNARNWNSSTLDTNDYFEFIITPNSGHEINFSSFVYTSQRSHNSISNFAFRSSLDGFTTDIGTPTFNGTTIDLSAIAYQNINTPITFRFYAWGASSSSRTYSINDFTFNASVTCITTSIWNGSTWSAGTPNISTNVIINGNYNTSTGNLSACSLTINSGFTLTVNNGSYVQIENTVVVDGELSIETQGNFVQNSDTGTFTLNPGGISRVNKLTSSKQAWYYYTYWSSPVSGETIADAFPNTDGNRRFWFNAANYLDANGDDIDDNGDDWTIATGTDIMTPGLGYAATSSRLGMYPSTDLATFIGPLNTGDITTAISYNVANTLGSWNFIGNPYPSAIDFVAFQAANSAVIDGAAYFWSQSSPPSSSNPGNEQQNFNQNDYATYTVGTGGAAGSSGIIPNQYVPSGQGFFIAGLANGNVTFTNAIRMADGTSNSQFFKSTNKKSKSSHLENKLWVNLTSNNGVFNQILIGYVAGATNEDDGLFYDAPKFLANEAAILYSRIPNSTKKYIIQGKAENSIDPFETIPLGFKTSINIATLYKLSIAQLKGDFLTNNTIYLKDNLLNLIHDLSNSDYTFTSETGEFNDRFEILFSSNVLSKNKIVLDENTLKIISLKNGDIQFTTANNSNIKSVTIFDLLGKQLYDLKNLKNSETFTLSNIKNTVFLAKIELTNGSIINKRLLNN